MTFGAPLGERGEASIRKVIEVAVVATKEMIVRIEQLGPKRDILLVVTAGKEEADII